MKIKVDLNGRPGDALKCPVALAIKRLLPEGMHVSVRDRLIIDDPTDGIYDLTHECRLDDRTLAFIAKVDGGLAKTGHVFNVSAEMFMRTPWTIDDETTNSPTPGDRLIRCWFLIAWAIFTALCGWYVIGGLCDVFGGRL